MDGKSAARMGPCQADCDSEAFLNKMIQNKTEFDRFCGKCAEKVRTCVAETAACSTAAMSAFGRCVFVLHRMPSRSINSHVQSVLRLGPFSGALLAQTVAPGSTKASMRPGLMQCAFTSPFDSSLTSMPSKTKCAVNRSVRLTKLPFVSGPSKGTTTGFVSVMAFAAAATQRRCLQRDGQPQGRWRREGEQPAPVATKGGVLLERLQRELDVPQTGDAFPHAAGRGGMPMLTEADDEVTTTKLPPESPAAEQSGAARARSSSWGISLGSCYSTIALWMRPRGCSIPWDTMTSEPFAMPWCRLWMIICAGTR